MLQDFFACHPLQCAQVDGEEKKEMHSVNSLVTGLEFSVNIILKISYQIPSFLRDLLQLESLKCSIGL
jgi:hypothetical protein